MEQQLTPKEKFDIEMKQINNDISAENAPEKEAGYSREEIQESEDQADEIEAAMDNDEVEETEIDKHVGTRKIEVTKEQHIDMKLEKQRQEILSKFGSVGGFEKEKLTDKQKETMKLVLKMAEDGELDDPVLKHLVSKKVDVAIEYAKLNAEIKEVQLMIVGKMTTLSKKCVESQTEAKTYNRDILLYVQKNPTVLDGDGSGA